MSFQPDRYDPDEVDERPKSGYLTPKDIRAGIIVILILLIIGYPAFAYFKRVTEEAKCSNNVKNIHEALSVYMQQFDDHFPPICAQGDNFEPALVDGKPITWATVISDGMSKRASFRCPSAYEDEVVHAAGLTAAQPDLPMSYGMYSPWSGAASADIANQGEAIVIAETSNFGAQDTYDPYPFKKSNGDVVKVDGFVIGWDKGNYVEQWQTGAHSGTDMPNHVTRLAFFGTAGGNFGEGARGRHFGKIHVLYVDGHQGTISPTAAAVRFMDVGGDLTGRWTTRGWPGANANPARR